MLVWAPMRMELTSPRRTAPYHTEDFSPMVTSPMTLAEGAMNPARGSAGTFSYIPMIVRCFEIASRNALLPCIEQPMRSSTWPVSRSAVPMLNMKRDIVT